jgi:hypothetical protein
LDRDFVDWDESPSTTGYVVRFGVHLSNLLAAAHGKSHD